MEGKQVMVYSYKTRRLVRESIYWPGFNKDVETLCRKCAKCQQLQQSNPKEPVTKH